MKADARVVERKADWLATQHRPAQSNRHMDAALVRRVHAVLADSAGRLDRASMLTGAQLLGLAPSKASVR